MKTYTKHPISGDAAEVKRLVLTDNNATAKEILSLWSGGECLFAKEANVTKSGNVMKDIDGNDVTAWTLQGERPMCSYPWEAEVVEHEGYAILPWSAKVMMGGVDITNSCYNPSTCKINIPMVKGDISVSIEAVAMDSAYKPVLYIERTTADANSRIALPYFPNNNTELEIDVLVKDVIGLLYGTKQNGTVNASVNNFFAYIKNTENNNGQFVFGHKSITGTIRSLIPNTRFTFKANKNSITYVRRTGATVTVDVGSTDTWAMASTSSNNLHLFGRSGSAPTSGAGRIYSCKIGESGVLLHRYLPVKRLSDGHAGLYDVVLGISTPYIEATAFSYPE